MGIKSWKEGFESFSQAVSQSICRTSHSNQKMIILDGEEPDESCLKQRFICQNLIKYTRYLVCQKCFAENMVYAPVKESNGKAPP